MRFDPARGVPTPRFSKNFLDFTYQSVWIRCILPTMNKIKLIHYTYVLICFLVISCISNTTNQNQTFLGKTATFTEPTSVPIVTVAPMLPNVKNLVTPYLPLCPNNYKTEPIPKGGCQVLEVSVLPRCSQEELGLCKVVSQQITTIGELGLSLTPLDVFTPTDTVTVVTTVLIYGKPVLTATSFSSEITGTLIIPSEGQ